MKLTSTSRVDVQFSAVFIPTSHTVTSLFFHALYGTPMDACKKCVCE